MASRAPIPQPEAGDYAMSVEVGQQVRDTINKLTVDLARWQIFYASSKPRMGRRT